MKYLHEFRDPELARRLVREIHRLASRPRVLMEVCGGQTHSIVRHGLDLLVKPAVELIHGPGCPVCVTPVETIDRALAIASRPEVLFCTFGDMLRVPGSRNRDLARIRAEGGDVRVIYTPLDALRLAQRFPEREVVLFAIGFETTAPANAMAALLAHRQRLPNFSMLVSHVLVPPALEAIVSSPQSRVEAFLAAGHVCSVVGVEDYRPLAARWHTPIVVTGFEPLDLLEGIRRALLCLERGEPTVENAYQRVVPDQGNPVALATIREVFEPTDRAWRGLGLIPASGWKLRPEYAHLDAEARFPIADLPADESPQCHSGLVLQGRLRPNQCPAFGTLCTPETPLGATMVSAEGACAAYYHSGRLQPDHPLSGNAPHGRTLSA